MPYDREYQVDGSDLTATGDRQPSILSLEETPLYHVLAWLRDEQSYSRWEHVRITDLASGAVLAPDSPLPSNFRVEAALRRPEAAAHLWLLGPGRDQREGLELDRDKRNARWLVQSGTGLQPLPRWFFPEQPAPFAAELLHLIGRSAAAGFGLAAVALAVASLLRRRAPPDPLDRLASSRLLGDAVLAAWLLASAFITVRLFHQLPHILDAVSYTFQAGTFATARLTRPEPPLVNAFKGPFEVLQRGQLFSQYPPGAPAVYAIGQAVHLDWLVGPLCCLVLIVTTSAVAQTLHGTSKIVLLLGALSPFILFQSGSFLSHPVAGGVLAGALAAFIAAQATQKQRFYLLTGALLGLAFLAREIASVLFAVPLAVRLLSTRNTRAITNVAVTGLPFVVLYLLYNWQVTGSPSLLPRQLFDASDRFGFGDGVGFHTRHTLAAGLANTDELLTDLQFEAFGWPPLFALGLLGVPFLFGRARLWDWLAALGVMSFVAAYVGYFYHGIALGPRYYFEAMPYVLLLAGRGVQVVAEVVRSRVAAALVMAALTMYAVTFYYPQELARRADLSGQPLGRRVVLAFVQSSLLGPRITVPQRPALVTTTDWWTYNTALAPLNCPTLPTCDVLFALATSTAEETQLRLTFPNRAVFRAIDNGAGQIVLVPT